MILRTALVNARRMGMQVPVRFMSKGPEGAPPQRFLSVAEGTGRFVIFCVVLLAYPTYMLMNLDNVRPRAPNELSEEMQAYINERKEARARGERDVLLVKPWRAEKKE